MERELAREVLAQLHQPETCFEYFRDRYALQLLAYAAAGGRRVCELRRGRFRGLLQKQTVQDALARNGRGIVGWDTLDSYRAKKTSRYQLTFGLWGVDGAADSYHQTTRGGWNLVLQLNFPAAHDRAYRRHVAPGDEHPFEFDMHPINQGGRHTLAWSRIDIDFDTGEALIEEVQSDWIRSAQADCDVAEIDEDAGCEAWQLIRYVRHILDEHRRVWEEATLSAALWLLRERFALRQIYMHTQAGGRYLKLIEGREPPYSIYEKLPRRFCFERTRRVPRFLRRQRGEPFRARLRNFMRAHQFWYLSL